MNKKGQFTTEVYRTKLMARREGFQKGMGWGFAVGSCTVFWAALVVLASV